MPNRCPGPDLLVVGAGPVGLTAANLAAAAGLRVHVLEKRDAPRTGSRAIGIMPPSLEIFRQLGLESKLRAQGVQVSVARVHGRRLLLGTVRFDERTAIVSIPQERTESVLTAALERSPGIVMERGVEITAMEQTEEGVKLGTADSYGPVYRAPFAIVCVGDKGARQLPAGAARTSKRHPQTFLMGDFTDRSRLGVEAHLFFTPFGAVESFPLPDGLRRWIVQTPEFVHRPDGQLLIDAVSARSGYDLSPADLKWLSPFGIQERVSRPYYDGRIVFCGDAAHVMPPIGGQGMNTGIADAWMAVRIAAASIRRGAPHAEALAVYDRVRALAAERALFRAVWAMRIGTLSGGLSSALRNGLIYLALHSPLLRLIPRHFSMRTLPFADVENMARLLPDQAQLQESEERPRNANGQ